MTYSGINAQIIENERNTDPSLAIDTVIEPKGKPQTPPEANRNIRPAIGLRGAVCSGTATINGCNGSVTIDKSCLQSNQYFSYAFYHTNFGNLACFAHTDQNCNITTEGWGMCLNYNKEIPYTSAFECYTTYRLTTDLSCVGITPLQASQILWIMNNAAAYGLNMSNQSDRQILNESIWGITNPSLTWAAAKPMAIAAKNAVTTPYTNIECRLTFLCPDNTTIQPFVLYSGINGGNPLSVGGFVSPNQTICLGQNSVPTTPSVSGYLGNIVRWEYADPGGVWVNWGGAGSVTAPSNCCFSSVGVWRIRAIIQNGTCPEVASSEAQVIVVPDPSVTTTGATTICTGGSATLTSTPSGGTGTCTVQWQSSTNNATWTDIAGATGNTYTATALMTNRYFRTRINCTGSNCDQGFSNAQLVTIVADPSVSVVAAASAVCVGGSVALNATLNGGTGTCTIQWQSSPNGTTWTNIAGATGNSYITPALNTATRYRAQVTCSGNGCCN